MSEVLTWAKAYSAENSIQALADLTGGKYTRTAISLYLNGKYPAGVEAIESTLRPLMTVRECPFLSREITAKDCENRRNRPMPFTKNSAMHYHWKACQACQYNTGDK